MSGSPEVWLRGPLRDVARELMPVAHALLQIREEIGALVPTLSREELWARPGGAASIGFHVQHVAGSLDRLLTYARGEALSPAQLAALEHEGRQPGDPSQGPDGATLAREVEAAIDRALVQVRVTRTDTLDEFRSVGRAALPSTVRGLLFHAAEHAQRHAGQIATTARIVRSQSIHN